MEYLGWGDGDLMASSELGPEEAGGEERSCVELNGTAVESHTAQTVGEERGRAVTAVGLCRPWGEGTGHSEPWCHVC